MTAERVIRKVFMSVTIRPDWADQVHFVHNDKILC